MIASEMAKAIQPEIVIYYQSQSGDNFAFDFLEEQRIQRNQFDVRVKYDTVLRFKPKTKIYYLCMGASVGDQFIVLMSFLAWGR